MVALLQALLEFSGISSGIPGREGALTAKFSSTLDKETVKLHFFGSGLFVPIFRLKVH